MAHWDKSSLLDPKVVEAMPKHQRIAFHLQTTQERMAKVDGKSHKVVLQEIVNWLALRGVVCCYGRMDKKSSITAGWPDVTFAKVETLIRCPSSHPCAVEIKVGRDVLSDDQLHCHAVMRANGWQIRVVSSLDEFIRFYNSIGE